MVRVFSKYYLLFFLCLVVGCDNPVVEPDPVNNGPSSSSVDPEIPNYVLLLGNVKVRVVDSETQDSLSQAQVYFDCFLNRPFPPYVDSYLINNDIPGLISRSTGSTGFANFNLDALVSDSKRDTIYLIMTFGVVKEGYRAASKSFNYNIPFEIKEDSISFEAPEYLIELSSIE
jgi:hypothetical protein